VAEASENAQGSEETAKESQTSESSDAVQGSEVARESETAECSETAAEAGCGQAAGERKAEAAAAAVAPMGGVSPLSRAAMEAMEALEASPAFHLMLRGGLHSTVLPRQLPKSRGAAAPSGAYGGSPFDEAADRLLAAAPQVLARIVELAVVTQQLNSGPAQAGEDAPAAIPAELPEGAAEATPLSASEAAGGATGDIPDVAAGEVAAIPAPAVAIAAGESPVWQDDSFRNGLRSVLLSVLEVAFCAAMEHRERIAVELFCPGVLPAGLVSVGADGAASGGADTDGPLSALSVACAALSGQPSLAERSQAATLEVARALLAPQTAAALPADTLDSWSASWHAPERLTFKGRRGQPASVILACGLEVSQRPAESGDAVKASAGASGALLGEEASRSAGAPTGLVVLKRTALALAHVASVLEE